MNENEINIYSNKQKALFLFLICFAFLFSSIIYSQKIKMFLSNTFAYVFIHLIMIAGLYLSLVLLFRRKPLLTITDTELIIYNPLYKTKKIRLEDVKSFQLFEVRLNFSRSSEILIELNRETEVADENFYFKILRKISSRLANTKYSIKPYFLKVNKNNLLNILNKRLKNVA